MDHLSLGRLLSAATRIVIERMHDELAQLGHPDLRPAYGYALFAIGEHGTTTSALGGALGMTKQGAAKLVSTLEQLDYVERRAHETDGRAQRLILTARGRDLLERSQEIQRDLEREWAELFGDHELRTLRTSLERAIEHDGRDVQVLVRPVW
jgi:DNA-binding MarR family transcriptional regulator